MSENKQPTKTTETKDIYLVHLESGSVSVEATSMQEAIKLAKSNVEKEEKSNG